MHPAFNPSVFVGFVFLVVNSSFCASSFSLASSVIMRRLQTQVHEPIILSLPDILSDGQSSIMLQSIESSLQNGTLKSTTSYQEDIFSKDKWDEEDKELKSMVRSLSKEDLLPSEYFKNIEDGVDPNAALQAFVYAVTQHQERLSEDDIILGANIIQRRKAMERWKSEEGRQIMTLSCDEEYNTAEVDWNSIRLGKRYELPPAIVSELQLLVPTVLRGSWITRDATLVKYSEGDSQVPHIDPCDATLLVCLKSCDEGGDTCFPSLDRPLRLENRAGSGLLFFSSQKCQGDASRDTLSLHHGGKITKGEKVVVQLMLDWNEDIITNGSTPTSSWLDVLVEGV
jgi:hypothetical protein